MTTPLNPNAASRVDYLAKIFPTTFKDNPASPLGAQAIAVGGPEQGQYWYPTFITIATTQGLDPTAAFLKPNCTIYAGAPGVYDETTYVDDTSNGNNDTSSIISGIMLQYGEVITAIWNSNTGVGVNTPPAVLKVFGFVSNIPLAASGYLPFSPGAHFVGHLETIAVAPTNVTSPGTLAGGGTFTTGLIDLSQFQSYTLEVQAITTSGPTNFNPVSISVQWFIAPFNQMSRSEFYEICAQQTGAFNSSDNGLFLLSDQCHGNWVQIQVHNDGPDNVLCGIGLSGNSRPMGGPYVRESSTAAAFGASESADNLILDSVTVGVGAGVATRLSSRIGCGRILMRMTSATQPFNFDLLFAGAAVSSKRFTVAAGNDLLQEYIFPNRCGLFTVTNTGAGAGTFTLEVFRQMPPW